MYQHYKFSLDDSNYNDGIRANPAHYNSMRAKPILPQALIENNISGIKCFPNALDRTTDEWKYVYDEKTCNKRCIFNLDRNEKIHLASLDTISNQHLLSPNLKLPHEDDVFRQLGQKRNLIDKRNGYEEFSPGDKSYRSVEYSNSFFSKKLRNWRDESFTLPKKSDEEDSPDLAQLLNLNQRTVSRLFSNQVDYDYEHDPHAEKFDETNQVKNLDTWRPKTPLQAPFKVLDTSEKALRYRPRVNR